MSKKKRKNQARAEAPAEENEKVSAGEDEEESSADEGEASGEAEAHASGDEHEAHADGHDDHGAAEDDRPRNGIIATAVVVTCVVVVLLVIGVKELFTALLTDEVQGRVLSVQSSQLRELRASEQQRLTHYQWASQKEGVVHIPTDRAVELTLAAYRSPPPPVVEEPKPAPQDVKPEEGKSEGKDEKGAKDEKKDEKKDDKKKDEKGKTEPTKEPKK
jgi:hypothetical protein